MSRKNRSSSVRLRPAFRLERLEDRLALSAASPVAVNDFYNDLLNQPLDVGTPGILANDSSPSGAPLSVGLFSGPAHGSLSLNADGSFHYVPETDFTGLDSFLYVASDGGGDSMLAAVTIDIGDGGPPPEAHDDSYSVDEDGVLSVALSDGVLANDTAAEGATLSAELVTSPANGTLSLGADGSFTYLPNANFNGADSFTYQAKDEAGDTALATATITVNPVNDKPAAANDGYSLSEDTTLTVDAAGGLLANDSDIDGDVLTPTITSQPLHGTVTLNPDGSFSYTPEANYNGLDGFSYLVGDGQTTSDVASATFIIQPVNDAPVSSNDQYTTAEDTPLTIDAPGVLVNDTDVDADGLSSILVNPPQNGTVTLGADGSLVYTPNANFSGVDGFSYLAGDGSADSEAAAVTITVTPVNDPPAAAADSYATDEDTPLVVSAAEGVLANDSDPEGDLLTATLVSSPANGSLTLNADGSFSYMPNANFNGTDSFVYQASDGLLMGEATTVALTVNPLNDPPAAMSDTYHTNEDAPLTIDAGAGVLANDSDPDGDALSAAIISGPANGTVTLNADGSFQYAPNANFNGTDTFVYQASDGLLTSEATTVTIDICPVNDAPTTADDAYSLDEGTSLTMDVAGGVLANDSDIDGDPLTASVVTGPANGTVTMNADGSFVYTPGANFFGSDSFVYQASDGQLATQATVALTVNQVVHAPIPAIDNYSTGEDVPLVVDATLGVLANDLNPDGGDMTAEVVTPPANGTLTLNPDGSFTYVAGANFHGSDSFTYKAIHNGQETVSSANIVVEPLNDAPVAANDEVTSDPSSGTPAAGNVLTNDADIDGDVLTASLVSGPAHGTLTLNQDGTFNYTAQSGFSGDDTFRYQAFDGKANSNVATVTVHVASSTSEAPPPPVDTPPPAENQPPLAVNDVFTTPGDTTLNVPASSGLLANDTDPDGNSLIASLFAGALHGVVSLSADGSFSYTPATGYSGLDAFLYRVSDGSLWSPLAAVTIHVTPSQTPDEAPLPTPAPTPDPEPCDSHHNSNVGENLLQALVSSPHQHHHASAVDAVFNRLGGWLS